MRGVRQGGGSLGPGARRFGGVQVRDGIPNYGAETGTDLGRSFSAVRATAGGGAELAGDPKLDTCIFTE